MKKIASVAALLAAGLVAHFEGFSPVTYWDKYGQVDTICYGHTQTAKEIRVRSKGECRAILLKELEGFAEQVDALILVDIHPNTLAASSSLAYNIGIGNFKKSTVLKRFNRGDISGGCDAFLLWNKAGGKVLKGLQRRRESERALCLDY